MPDSKVTEAASFLADYWRCGAQVDHLPEDLRPISFDQAYDIQDALFKSLNYEAAGWKLAVASDLQVQQFGLKRALVGRLCAPRFRASGDFVETPSSGALTIEAEIGLVLAHDIGPELDRTVCATDIASLSLNFEIVRSRYIDRKSVGWPAFVADDAAFEVLVLGAEISDRYSDELVAQLYEDCTVECDGEVKARPMPGAAGIDPLKSLQHLIDHAAERGETVKAGEPITTGAFCTPFDLSGRGHQLRLVYQDYDLSFRI